MKNARAANKTVMWTGESSKRDTGSKTIIMQSDGNFVMYDINENAQCDLGTIRWCPTGTHLSSNSMELKLVTKKNFLLEFQRIILSLFVRFCF